MKKRNTSIVKLNSVGAQMNVVNKRSREEQTYLATNKRQKTEEQTDVVSTTSQEEHTSKKKEILPLLIQSSCGYSTTQTRIEFKLSHLNDPLKISDIAHIVRWTLDCDAPAPPVVSVLNRPDISSVVVLSVPVLSHYFIDKNIDHNEPLIFKNSRLIRCGQGDLSLVNSINVDSTSPLHAIAELFPLVLPLKGEVSNSRIHHPANSFTKLSSKDASTVARRIKYNNVSNNFSVIRLLHAPEILKRHGYPLHPLHGGEIKEGWVCSNVSNSPTEDDYVLLAMDCEMCITEDGLELARISIVDENRATILDELVLPEKPIVDYNTRYSGITADHLEYVTTRIQDIQKKLVDLVTEKTILIGQSLENDLKACRFMHPFIIDTAICYMQSSRGKQYKQSLKNLAERHLKRKIQQAQDESGHCSAEDALACLDLVKFKVESLKKLSDMSPDLLDFFKSFDPPRKTLWIDTNSSCDAYGFRADSMVQIENDDDVVSAINQESNFTWAQLHLMSSYLYSTAGAVNPETKNTLRAPKELEEQELFQLATETCSRIEKIHENLPKGTLFIVFSHVNRTFADFLELQREGQEQNSAFAKESHIETLSKLSKEARSGLAMFSIK